mgnify:FL=1
MQSATRIHYHPGKRREANKKTIPGEASTRTLQAKSNGMGCSRRKKDVQIVDMRPLRYAMALREQQGAADTEEEEEEEERQKT